MLAQTWRETQPNPIRMVDGIPEKLDSDRIASLGNAIVPQVAFVILQAIKDVYYDQSNTR